MICTNIRYKDFRERIRRCVLSLSMSDFSLVPLIKISVTNRRENFSGRLRRDRAEIMVYALILTLCRNARCLRYNLTQTFPEKFLAAAHIAV